MNARTTRLLRGARARIVPLGLLLLAGGLVGCQSASQLGDFLTGGRGDSLNAPESPNPSPQAGAPGANDVAEIARTIEEADVVKVVGDRVYVLNRYKGLVVIDVASPDSPVVAGSLDVRGRGVEMYVIGERAFVLLSADFYPVYYGDGLPVPATGSGGGSAGATPTDVAPIVPPGPLPLPPEYSGSQLAIINVADAAHPAFVDKLNLVGYANASRRVGDVIYVVGNNNPGYFYGVPSDQENEGFVASVVVANPTDAQPGQRKTFSGQGLLMHVSDDAIFAASQTWDSDAGDSKTHIQMIDITDPAGAIVLRGTVDVPGYMRNRFYMDDFAGALRVATESNGFGFRTVNLRTYSLDDPDHIAPLGAVEIKRGESLEAMRFDGPRGYAVTFLRRDPLFVLDLSDPEHPTVDGHLEVPGYSTHIEPRGDRLIAVGIDDTDGNRPAVAYYDVSDPTAPAELGRVVLGPPGSFTESNATYDEKAFKIVDELGLIAIPFRHVEHRYYIGPPPGGIVPLAADDRASFAPTSEPSTVCMNGVQLVDFSDTGLEKRGWFSHDGQVERVGLIGARVFALSQAAFQTVNISDRDHPEKAGQANLVSPSEMPYYLDDCNDYFPPIFVDPLPFPFDSQTVGTVIDILVNGRLCGTISILPGMFLMGAIGLMKTGRMRARRRRSN
ncbi:MAG: beta-propeller domain-containing protein [Phycisphaerae bacterium]